MSTMTIIRGVSGSGKSNIADALSEWFENCVVCEADDYFYDDQNRYNFKPELLDLAHQWCYNKVYNTLKENKNPIISNTSLLEKHVQLYIDLANEFGADIQIISCQSTFENIHQVPKETLDKQKRRMCYKHFNLGR